MSSLPRPNTLPIVTHPSRARLAGLAALLLGIQGCLPLSGEPGQPAVVISVGDGDTIRVRQGGDTLTVRLACIDAPEIAQKPDGPTSRDWLLRELPRGTAITLRPRQRDRYGRLVAEVTVPQLGRGVHVNVALVRAGQAFVDRRYLANCEADPYLKAEERARQERRGVWRKPGGVERPWSFRRSLRRDGTAG